MQTQISCPFCHSTGFLDDPPAFSNAGELSETPNRLRPVCEGSGYIQVENPQGLRIAMLVSRKVHVKYPHLQSWEAIYQEIATNIVNTVNYNISNKGLSFQP